VPEDAIFGLEEDSGVDQKTAIQAAKVELQSRLNLLLQNNSSSGSEDVDNSDSAEKFKCTAPEKALAIAFLKRQIKSTKEKERNASAEGV
jgi:hypothetical protein